MKPFYLAACIICGLLLVISAVPGTSSAQELEAWEGDMALDNLAAGRLLAHEGRYKSAIARYDRALASGKLDEINQSIAYNNRGNAHAALGEPTKAIADYDQALSLIPGFIEALYNRGIAYYQMERNEESVADFTQVLQVNVGFASAYFNRSFPLAKLGRFKEAIADVRQAMSLRPEIKRYASHLDDLQALARESATKP
jgi:tetratricopeptide (TPR) repeat protein